MKHIQKYPRLMIVVGILGISMSAIFVKYSEAPSAVTAAFRLLWTVLLMTPVVFGRKDIRRELMGTEKRIWCLSVLAGLFLAIHFVLWFESLQHTTVASSTTIVCTEVLWVSLGFCVFMKGRLSFRAVAAMGAAFLGSIAIAWSDATFGETHLYGDILALLAAVAVAVYTLIGRKVRREASTAVYTYIVYTACAGVLLIVCFAQGYGLFHYGSSAWIVGFLLAVFSTLLGHSIFSWCLKFFSPSFVSASKLCEPVAAALMACFLFHEIPSLIQVAGGILILGGVYYYSCLEG